MPTPAVAASVVTPQDPTRPPAHRAPDRGVPEPAEHDQAASAVPEPAPFLLVGFGLLGLAISSRKWRRAISDGKG
ncbi:MAG: PEP-CTERM sorting domain-containing protein [Planctomycetota bacterium]